MLNRQRRDFINLLPYIVAGGLTYPTGKFLFFKQNSTKRVAIPLKNIKDGITHIKNPQFFIYKKGKFIDIYNAHCTHMGCILNFEKTKKEFNCPCHKSKFDIKGKLLRGPAKRDLDKIPFNIKNQTIFIG